MLPSISETNTLFGVSYCTVWRWTLRRKGIEYLTNSEGKCLLVYSSFPALTTAVVLGSLYCFWLGLGHTSLTFQREAQSKQRRGVLWRHWPRLCSHLISCLLTSCDQSDYWNNKYHCWHKMDVACPAGWRKTVAYLPCSFWGLAWTLQWLYCCVSVGSWKRGDSGSPLLLPISDENSWPPHVWLMEIWLHRTLHPLWDWVVVRARVEGE